MQVTFDFSGYRVLVAGGSKGIGRAMALGFAEAGADVSVCARGEQDLQDLAGILASGNGKVHTLSTDLANPSAIARWVEEAADTLGGIDVLVNNASGYGFDDADDEHWLADFNVDLMAAVRASRLAHPYLARSTHASIINTSSISALHPRAAGAPYAALKAALTQYTTSQAMALAAEQIRVNAIAPGSIEFEDGMWDRVRRDDPKRYAATRANIPFARYGTPDEVAHVAMFLASPLAAWVTGQILCVDGGQSLNG